MRTLGTHLSTLVAAAHIEGLCRAFAITRKDGGVVRFAETTASVVLGDGNTYEPGIAIQVGSIPIAMNESAAQVEIECVAFAGSTLDIGDVQDGLYSGGTLSIMLADYLAPSEAPAEIFFGDIGEVQYNNLGWVQMQAIGPLGRARNYVNESYGPSCRAFFTDPRCGVDAAGVTFPGAIVSASSRFITVSGTGQAAAYFNLGLMTITSGRLKGRKREIRSWDGSVAELYADFGIAPQPGDGVTLRAGCSYDLNDATGCPRWNNILNFRGEPYCNDDAAIANTNGPIGL